MQRNGHRRWRRSHRAAPPRSRPALKHLRPEAPELGVERHGGEVQAPVGGHRLPHRPDSAPPPMRLAREAPVAGLEVVRRRRRPATRGGGIAAGEHRRDVLAVERQRAPERGAEVAALAARPQARRRCDGDGATDQRVDDPVDGHGGSRAEREAHHEHHERGQEQHRPAVVERQHREGGERECEQHRDHGDVPGHRREQSGGEEAAEHRPDHPLHTALERRDDVWAQDDRDRDVDPEAALDVQQPRPPAWRGARRAAHSRSVSSTPRKATMARMSSAPAATRARSPTMAASSPSSVRSSACRSGPTRRA